MERSLCWSCRYFKQYQPLRFMTAGECQWMPAETTPYWLQEWLDTSDIYYGPKRDVRGETGGHMVLQCDAYKQQ